ncbi:MAG: phosphoenolpyruvate--protein phosphotransferase [Gemmatimonadetes bacterium]|nr:MAG: phosphoenolpyruvate--protein phosphotransferase [Gemmatimonadota bacterium]
MSRVFDGYAAAEGIASGPIHRLDWGVPAVPHEVIEASEVERELDRFADARSWVRDRILEIKARTEARLGPVEARIFDPQLLMLDDPEMVDEVTRYIRDNRLSAARAFEWRMLEIQARWTRTGHAMVLDRLNDLEDLQIRLLHRLLGLPDPSDLARVGTDVVLVTRDLTPSLTVQLDPKHVLAIAADRGTRTAHWVILARSLEIPTVVGLGSLFQQVRDGQEAIVDGRIGRVVVDPDERDRAVFLERRRQLEAWEEEAEFIATQDAITADGQPVALRANLDLPGEAQHAAHFGAQGIGLFRTEFLVVGRNAVPDEDEQYEAYRAVTEHFPHHAVYIRTFDLGGDKFPMFLHMPREENPFLGWRAIRVCLDMPELFRTQLRAILRSTAHGDVRIMLPLINDVEEISRVRELLEEEEDNLKADGVPFNPGYKVGILVETPAAALEAVELSRHCDFFSIGTNDLTQYTLAVDRTNSRLARLFNPFHPAVVRQLAQVARVAKAAGIEVSVCGEMAANPMGAFLLLGLDITSLSVAWPSLPEIKKVIRQFRVEDARRAAAAAVEAQTGREVAAVLTEGIGATVDLSVFAGRWNLSPG